MEEVEQPRNDELAKEANAKGAKDRGAGERLVRPKERAAGEAT